MHRIVRDLQLQVRRASFVGTRRGHWDALQHHQQHRPRGGVGRQETCSFTLTSMLKPIIRLPQREDVWSMKERYCIDRGHQPSQVDLRPVNTITGFTAAVSMRRTCVASTNIFARSMARYPSELATEESHRAG
jgi:hypothetical protein